MSDEVPSWELSIAVTCSDAEAEGLLVELLELADGRGYGAAASMSLLEHEPEVPL